MLWHWMDSNLMQVLHASKIFKIWHIWLLWTSSPFKWYQSHYSYDLHAKKFIIARVVIVCVEICKCCKFVACEWLQVLWSFDCFELICILKNVNYKFCNWSFKWLQVLWLLWYALTIQKPCFVHVLCRGRPTHEPG